MTGLPHTSYRMPWGHVTSQVRTELPHTACWLPWGHVTSQFRPSRNSPSCSLSCCCCHSVICDLMNCISHWCDLCVWSGVKHQGSNPLLRNVVVTECFATYRMHRCCALSCVPGFVDVVFLISYLSKFQSVSTRTTGQTSLWATTTRQRRRQCSDIATELWCYVTPWQSTCCMR